MQRKLMLLIFVLAMLVAFSAAPVYAGDDKGGSNPPPCTQCDGGQVWSG